MRIVTIYKRDFFMRKRNDFIAKLKAKLDDWNAGIAKFEAKATNGEADLQNEYNGSIGWEDSNHQHHMHTSVPYCANRHYGDYCYRR